MRISELPKTDSTVWVEIQAHRLRVGDVIRDFVRDGYIVLVNEKLAKIAARIGVQSGSALTALLPVEPDEQQAARDWNEPLWQFNKRRNLWVEREAARGTHLRVQADLHRPGFRRLHHWQLNFYEAASGYEIAWPGDPRPREPADFVDWYAQQHQDLDTLRNEVDELSLQLRALERTLNGEYP